MNFFKAPKPSNVFDDPSPPPASTYTSSNAYSSSNTNTTSAFPTDSPNFGSSGDYNSSPPYGNENDKPSFSNSPNSIGIDDGDNINSNSNNKPTFPTDNPTFAGGGGNTDNKPTFPTDNPSFANNVPASEEGSGCCNPRRAGVWTIVTLIAGFILFTVGGALVPLGFSQQSAANDLDADSDFYEVKNSCQILNTIFIRTKQETGDKGRKTGCKDYYEYQFDAYNLTLEDEYYVGLDDYVFISREQISVRECNDCNRCDRAYPAFEDGDYVKCWRPETPGGQFIPKQYRCGNEECIKVFDPQDDVDRAKGIAMAMWISGLVVVTLAIPLCVFGVIFFGVQKRRGGFGRR